MYVVIVYDVGERRVQKVCKYLRTVLQWVQNSVFEGTLTESQYARVWRRLSELIDENHDSILVYTVSAEQWVRREVLGIEKLERTNFL